MAAVFPAVAMVGDGAQGPPRPASRTGGSRRPPPPGHHRRATEPQVGIDIIEHPATAEGNVYCCAVKDLFSNRIAGDANSDRMTAANANAASANPPKSSTS